MTSINEQLAPLALEDVLQGDGVPDENQALACMSCGEPMRALHCGACGQKNDDFRRPLWKLGAEAFASLTAFESRIWRTWGNLLLRPGRVAREYADGRRAHWSSPVRMYLFMSIALFGFMELTGTYFFAFEFDLKPRDGVAVSADVELSPDDVSLSGRPHAFPTSAQVESWNQDLDFELLGRKLRQAGGMFEDSTWFFVGVDADDVPDMLEDLRGREDSRTPEQRKEVIASLTDVRAKLLADAEGPAADGLQEAAAQLDAAIAAERARLEAASAPTGTPAPDSPEAEAGAEVGAPTPPQASEVEALSAGDRFLLDFIRNPAIGNDILNRWLPRIIFLMMPLTMLIAALFIRGKGPRRRRGPQAGEHRGHEALLYDHIVHAAYIHAVAYLLIFAGILLSRVVPGSTVAGAIMVALAVYLPLSLRRMFGRGWFKTLWTAYGVAFLYFVIVFTLTTWAVADGITAEIAAREWMN